MMFMLLIMIMLIIMVMFLLSMMIILLKHIVHSIMNYAEDYAYAHFFFHFVIQTPEVLQNAVREVLEIILCAIMYNIERLQTRFEHGFEVQKLSTNQ